MGSEHLANAASMTVWSPGGFRGALHRTDDDEWTVIGVDEAAPGCLAGPLSTGSWELNVETALILNDGAETGYLTWHVEAVAEVGGDAGTSGATVASQAARPVASTLGPDRPAPTSGARWYRGDLHCHTLHSDGSFTVDERLERAVARGLDFLAITDHNTVSHHRELDPWRDRIVPIRGSEVTTFHGHMNVFGLSEVIDWRADRRGGGAAGIVAQAHRQGALVSINHPSSFGDPWCVGCHWDFARVDYSTIDTMEVWNGGWADVETANEANVALWTDLLDAGVRITAISGTDSHGPVDDDDPTLGFVHVHAAEASEATILQAIGRGRVFLSSGAILSFRARDSRGGEITVPGSDMAADGRLDLRVNVQQLAEAATVWFVTSGSIVSIGAIGPGDHEVVGDGLVAKAWWRLEVRAGSESTGDMLALTNPVYVSAA